MFINRRHLLREVNMTTVLTGSMFGPSALIATTNDDYIIYGNVQNFGGGLFAVTSVDSTAETIPITIQNSTFQLPNDLLVGSSGNDTIYGDIGLFSFNLYVNLMATNSGSIDFSSNQIQSQFIMGNDIILAGGGNNIIFGDTDFTQPFATLQVNVLAMNNSSITGTVIIENVMQVYGNDTIIAGNGNNWISGDTGVMQMAFSSDLQAHGDGSTVYFDQQTLTCSAYYGNDTIIVGSGNDRIYGDGPNFVEPTFGYNVSADGAGASGYSNDLKENFSCVAGNDSITAGAGNDVVFADWEACEIDAIGAHVSALNGATVIAMATDDHRQMISGNDTIYGGSGNDLICADTVTSKLLVIDGVIDQIDGISTATSTATITNLVCKMGDDIVFAGAGNDIVATDGLRCISDYNGLIVSDYHSLVRPDAHLQLFENDGGNNYNNSLILGNDTVSLGAGNDVLLACMYSVDNGTKMAWSGLDVITDFSKANDTLVIDRVVDLNHDNVYDWHDMDAAATFTHQGGNTVVTFNGGGSLTLMGVNVNSFHNLNVEVNHQYEGYNIYVEPSVTVII